LEVPIHIAAFPRWNCRDPSRGRPSVPPAVWAVTGHPIGSILAHGFDAVSTGARGELEKALNKLEDLFLELTGRDTAKSYLAWSRWLDFSPAPA
jgi:hypothetical protein